MPVLVRQMYGNLTAAEGDRRTKGNQENVHSTHAHGPQAWKESVAQLYARHQNPKERKEIQMTDSNSHCEEER